MYEVTATIDKDTVVSDRGRTVDEAKVKIMKRYPDKFLNRIKSVELRSVVKLLREK